MLGRVVSQWRRRQSSVRTRLTRIVNRALEKVGVRSRQRRKGRSKGNEGRNPHPRREYGPCGLVCADPPIIQTGIAFEEYAGIAPAFGRMHGSLPAAFLIYPCWTLEDRRRSAAVIAAARAHQEKYPAHELVFLCNSEAERRILSRAGLKAHFLNKNFTVSETIFRPLSEVEVAFDAIYNARIDPDKRHDLAQGIERVAYISYVDSTLSAGARQKQRETLAGMLARQPHHVLLNPIEDGLPVRLLPEAVNEALNRAAVGLCLSSVEGSNYVSFADVTPILLTSAISLADLSDRAGLTIDMRRFRPNLVVSGASPWEEDTWRAIRVGAVRFRVAAPCARCAITTRDPDTGAQIDPYEPLRTLQRIHRGRDGGAMFGQYLIPDNEGTVALGDKVEVLSAGASNLS